MFGPVQTRRALERFESSGKEIRVETFATEETEGAPSIIVLHGATGVEFANRFMAVLAHGFATQGFVIRLVRYFDRTGGGSPELCISPGEGHVLQLPTCLDVVRRGTQFLQAQLRREARA